MLVNLFATVGILVVALSIIWAICVLYYAVQVARWRRDPREGDEVEWTGMNGRRFIGEVTWVSDDTKDCIITWSNPQWQILPTRTSLLFPTAKTIQERKQRQRCNS